MVAGPARAAKRVEGRMADEQRPDGEGEINVRV